MSTAPASIAPDWTGALARAEAHAPFLSRAMHRLPALTDLLAAGEIDAALAYAHTTAPADAPDVPTALRRERLALALAIAIADLAGAFPLARVTHELTSFADRALDAAITHAIAQRAPGVPPQGFTALALGKQGAGELNYSSDIDPILLYDPLRLPRRPRDDPAEAAQHIARAIVSTLGHVDAEGYVLRVDLRLRPASEVSPLALPIEAALSHYESAALAWERAAYIRARAAAGDIPMGEHFLAQIRPFVWRKSLDFGALAEIGRLTRRIRAAHGKVATPGPGFCVKRGRGGIREVEFYAQTLQLIHGGRNPALRLRGTRASLDALAQAGIIDPADALLLGQSYDRLRTIEHRLQMVSDRQTHSLPKDPAAIDTVAQLDGLPDGAALIDELSTITEAVGQRYDQLITASRGATTTSMAAASASDATTGTALAEELARLGFVEPETLAARIEGWRGGSVRALRSDAAQVAFDAVQPTLLAALARAADPMQALTRWEQLIARLPTALNLFHLLAARPALLGVLVRVLSLAPPLADALARRADLLDALIDATAFDLPPDVPALVAAFAAPDATADYQIRLDHVRRKVGELRFALGVQLVEGSHDPLAIGAALARVAEAAIAVLAEATAQEFAATHGMVPGGDLVLLGLGRLGGGVLTHASDLDLIYLFSGDFATESDGRRPLGATAYFNRLAGRVTAALSVPTAEGALYEVDTRLRPQGAQGLLAVNIDSFARYQREEAWTWEHMALARARVLFGPTPARAELAGVIAGVFARPRDPAKLREEVLDMRRRMAEHKAPRGPLDVKLMRGGLVDIEFLVHFLQLRDGAAHAPIVEPDLSTAIAAIGRAGLLSPANAEALAQAQAFLTQMLIASRLLAPDCAPPPSSALPLTTAFPAAAIVLAKACQCDDWNALMVRLGLARTAVASIWADMFGETLELA